MYNNKDWDYCYLCNSKGEVMSVAMKTRVYFARTSVVALSHICIYNIYWGFNRYNLLDRNFGQKKFIIRSKKKKKKKKRVNFKKRRLSPGLKTRRDRRRCRHKLWLLVYEMCGSFTMVSSTLFTRDSPETALYSEKGICVVPAEWLDT